MQTDSLLRQFYHKIGFCIRVLLDLLSDITFHIVYWRNYRRGLPSVTNDILLHSAVSLASKIRTGKVTSEQLVQACICRIKEVNSLLNAVVDQRYEAALAEARRCDKLVASLYGDEDSLKDLARTKPFLGIPFSTKEGISVTGLNHSYGLVSRKDIKATEDAAAVKLLREAGAIPLCVTNVSELGSWWHSSNNVYGATSNPHNLSHCPGGSSGGEAALQASGGIILSLASDTGGSIRTPAGFCGLFGHKPSPQTVSTHGSYIHNDVDPDLTLQTLGPITRHAEDMAPILKVLLGDNSHLLSLDNNVALSKCKFYLLTTQIGGNLTSMLDPEVTLALQRVVDYVEDNYGVTVKSLHLPELYNCLSLFSSEVSRATSTSLCKDAGISWVSWELVKMIFGRSSNSFPVLIQALMERMIDFFKISNQNNENNDYEFTDEVLLLKNRVQNILGENGIILSPLHPTLPPYQYQSYTKPFNFLYSAVFNMLGLPATVIPVGLSQSRLPLCVQVAAGPYNDHLTLALAQQLEIPFGGWVQPF